MKKQLFMPARAVLALCAILMSCSDDTAINKVLGGYAEAPVFIAYKAASGTEIEFQFSVPVKVIDVFLDADAEFEPFPEIYEPTIALRFLSDRPGGESVTAGFLVEDADGNSLNLLVPFKTRNERMPKILINEVRLDCSKPASEFIEFRTQSTGNLGAMRLFAASTSIEDPIYEFPPVEVAAGEYITLHIRTRDAVKEVDELDGNLKKAKSEASKDVNDETRDLWVPGSVKYLHKADVIYLLDQDDRIIDALLIAEGSSDWSKNKNLSKAAEFMAKQGAWLNKDGEAVKTPDHTDTVVSTGTTQTRTLCRDETKADSNTLADWYICYTSNATPGDENSSKRHGTGSTSKSVKSVSASR
ncbi:MAG: hypothetical protein LBJ86_03535 [Spirochaetaceae bacterium]|jgi:hypothetical protein|nr:hypothetical protein [Spirochaetaceae bacterium]